MLVDSFVDMYQAGQVTNRLKQNPSREDGYTFALGSQKLL